MEVKVTHHVSKAWDLVMHQGITQVLNHLTSNILTLSCHDMVAVVTLGRTHQEDIHRLINHIAVHDKILLPRTDLVAGMTATLRARLPKVRQKVKGRRRSMIDIQTHDRAEVPVAGTAAMIEEETKRDS